MWDPTHSHREQGELPQGGLWRTNKATLLTTVHSPFLDGGCSDRDFPSESSTGWLDSCSDLESWLSKAKIMKDYCVS